MSKKHKEKGPNIVAHSRTYDNNKYEHVGSLGDTGMPASSGVPSGNYKVRKPDVEGQYNGVSDYISDNM